MELRQYTNYRRSGVLVDHLNNCKNGSQPMAIIFVDNLTHSSRPLAVSHGCVLHHAGGPLVGAIPHLSGGV
jgi:hypothetical protein